MHLSKTSRWAIVSLTLFASIHSGAHAQETTNLVYSVVAGEAPPECSLRPKGESDEGNVDAKDYLTGLCHVTWPAGSLAVVSDDRRHYVIRNTRDNLEQIKRAFSDHLQPPQVDIEWSLVAFRQSDIEKLQNEDRITAASLRELMRKGRSRLVTSARTLTKSGQEARFRDVREITYQTELVYESATNRSGQASFALLPCNPEMREAGTILQCVPDTAGSDTFVNLMITCQWVALRRWENYEAASGAGAENPKVSLRTPVFDVTSLDSQITVRSGEPTLIGGGKNLETDWICFQFLKAEIIKPKPTTQAIGASAFPPSH